MNSRGFFSVFIAMFAVILLITLIYSQSTQQKTDARILQLAAAEQELSKDWFLARNAYTNFAADAIADQVKDTILASTCDLGPPPGPDFSGNIQTYWNDTYVFLLTKGVDCQATLSSELYSDLGDDALHPHGGVLAVHNNERAYGILTCLRSIGDIDLNYTHPFVILKEIELAPDGLGGCNLKVHDNLGASTAGVMHVATDVEFTYS